MSIHEADALNSRAAEVADWLHSAIDIPGFPLGTMPHQESTQEIHFGIPSTLTEPMGKEIYQKFFGPRAVSIGPIHHEKPHVKPMEYLKRKAVMELAERVKDDVSIEKVYARVEEQLLKTRKFYSPRFEQTSDPMWCLMMFLDACFIIEFICNDNIITSCRRSWLNVKKRDRDLVRHDLLLYDNQLPFQVIDALARAFRCEEFTLDLLTTRFLQMPLLNISSAPSPTFLDYIKGVSCLQRQQGEAQAPVHLLQYYKDLWIGVLLGDDIEEEDNNKEEDLCPPFTATELKKADFKELRARGIIQINGPAGDDQLIKFLRDITVPTESNPQAIRNVKRQISTYFTSKRLPLVIACAEMKQRYFSGPWSFLVFLAIIFTVSMTVIQTIFTGVQTYK
ncbi:uncharacterized protein LOC107852724 isoform X2 [Capsicum annuum]|uniref:uncharacterized protein LOC107852724 isoform X2 n=1 Tax=Capsicum annuum TaxID=4072 RepID=UPI001FB06A02|nr:uncharacterized protein LOC107852724 isoform X2 [Capsicum annuum]